ncbi:unnamed protein product [Cylindrotheca closterium]|uniref:Kinesin light chain n=1 Tax=Cylindrotheca closterium TaxID=2856 RepID=A0AAD2CYH3_9STRA|nr:unnamed protein product [Cylindrotheca closterium]
MVKILPKMRVKKIRDQTAVMKRKSASCEDTLAVDDEHSEAVVRKMTRQDKLAAQKLHKERERTARAAATLDDKGNQLFERGHFDKAMACYSKALKMKRRTFNNMLEDAEDLTNSTKLSKSDSQVLVSMATSINNIGYLRQRSGEASASETMAAYQKSLRIKRRILGNDNLSVGKTLNNIGSVYYITRDFEGALDAYSEAMEIMVQNLGDSHPDIATVMSNIGDVHLANGKDENCLKYYRSALNIRYANFGKHDPRVVRLLEKIARIEIGDMMISQDDQSMMDKDWEDRSMASGMRPLQAEYQILNGELKADIEYLDALQERVSKNVVQEHAEVAMDMQDPPSVSSYDAIGDGSDLEYTDEEDLESLEDDYESDGAMIREARAPDDDETDFQPGAPCRKAAQEHVNSRLNNIRELRPTSKRKENHLNKSQANRRDTMSSGGSNEMYNHYYGQLNEDNNDNDNDKSSVSSTSSDDVFGQYYGQMQTSSSGLRAVDPNAAVASTSATIRKSKIGSERGNRRVIITS